MEEPELKLGANINISHGFETAPGYAKSIGANFIQIFLRNPQSYIPNPRKKKSLKKFKKELKRNNCGCVVHSSFVINLARSPDQYQHYKGVDVIIEDLNHSVKIGAIGAIIHMGKNIKEENMSEKDAINNYVTGIETALLNSDEKSILILETGAGCGTEICTKLEKLGKIRSMVNKKMRHRVKFCIDTCHIFSAGYPINCIDYIDVLNIGIDILLGWENVAVIHLNDSKAKCNACVDRHADIGKGYIGAEPLVKFVNICKKRKVPVVLETPVDKYDGNKFTHEQQISLIKGGLKMYEYS